MRLGCGVGTHLLVGHRECWSCPSQYRRAAFTVRLRSQEPDAVRHRDDPRRLRRLVAGDYSDPGLFATFLASSLGTTAEICAAWWVERDYSVEKSVGSTPYTNEPSMMSGQAQADEHNLASGGLLSRISPVSETVK
jgi:hypothetical protein